MLLMLSLMLAEIGVQHGIQHIGLSAHIKTYNVTVWVCPIRSYSYTVAIVPLPYKNVLKHRTQQTDGGISILIFNTFCF
jgi:hypothetical protein